MRSVFIVWLKSTQEHWADDFQAVFSSRDSAEAFCKEAQPKLYDPGTMSLEVREEELRGDVVYESIDLVEERDVFAPKQLQLFRLHVLSFETTVRTNARDLMSPHGLIGRTSGEHECEVMARFLVAGDIGVVQRAMSGGFVDIVLK